MNGANFSLSNLSTTLPLIWCTERSIFCIECSIYILACEDEKCLCFLCEEKKNIRTTRKNNNTYQKKVRKIWRAGEVNYLQNCDCWRKEINIGTEKQLLLFLLFWKVCNGKPSVKTAQFSKFFSFFEMSWDEQSFLSALVFTRIHLESKLHNFLMRWWQGNFGKIWIFRHAT